MPSPEELASRYVTVEPCHNGSPCVSLRVPGAEPIEFGPYPNPSVAREKAEALRLAIAAVLVAGRAEEPTGSR